MAETIKKGHDQIEIDEWEHSGKTFVSLSIHYFDYDNREWKRKRGGFACLPEEAREIGQALFDVADRIEGRQ